MEGAREPTGVPAKEHIGHEGHHREVKIRRCEVGGRELEVTVRADRERSACRVIRTGEGEEEEEGKEQERSD